MKSMLSLAAVVTVALLAAQPAAATVPADLCTGNPCTVTGAKTIDSGAALDFGNVDLVFASNAVVNVEVVSIDARSITMQAGARIVGGADSSVSLTATGGDIQLLGSGSNRSRIDLRANQAGSIFLLASGNVQIDGVLDTSASGADAIGGDVSIEAGGAITINQPINAGATGNFSAGGGIDLTALGSITVAGALTTSGASSGGGSISIDSANGNVNLSAAINASGGSGGAGGSIDIFAGGDIVVSAAITGQGSSGFDFGTICDFGSDVTMDAGGSVTVGATINASGGTFCGGGVIDITAGVDFTQLAGGSIIARGSGASAENGFGTGGFVDIKAGRHATLRTIDLSAPGDGGFISVLALGDMSVLDVLDVEATGTNVGAGAGNGGTVSLQACNVTVGPSGFLDARGAAGTGVNEIKVGGLATVQGQMRAPVNRIVHRGLAPVITGTVVPAATITVDPNLPDCVELAACGNGQLDENEACDDGNNESCDGCSADCTRIDAVCGDGLRECSEACDDGNTIPGDGCEANCTLPPTEGVLLPGATLATAGCMAEWKLAFANPAINPKTQFPSNTQTCTDGDPGCDLDGTRDGVCTFDARLCIRVPDDRIPTCSPDPIEYINIKQPQLPGGSNPLDQHNAQVLANALKALGGQVRSGSTILQSGPPLTGTDVCTETMNFKVKHPPSGIGRRAFNVLAKDTSGRTMSSNLVRLWCAPNTSVCGNGILEPSEQCDDGNTASCDGCTSTCRIEACGNGVLECGEQCDDGPLNGTPNSRCSATCTELPPELRIPGGGAKPLDCALEWAMELDNVATNAKGVPKPQQVCTDNDPTCDFDPTPGNCRFRLWACLGGDDARLGCSAAQVSSAAVKAPGPAAKKPEDIAARAALQGAVESFTFPAGPGEVCSDGFTIDVPAGKRKVTLRLEARLASGKKDIDPLGLKCLPAK